MLYTADMLRSDFEELEVQLLEERDIQLDEGAYHKGPGYVTRLVATNPAA